MVNKMIEQLKRYVSVQKENLKYRLMNKSIFEVKIRRDAHRLDKARYNDENYISDKRYFEIKTRLSRMLNIWNKKNYSENNPTIVWALDVLKDFSECGIQGKKYSKENYQQIDFFKIIKERRSIRSWTEKKISNEIIESLIDAARWAPSSGNRQSCMYLVVQEKKRINILGQLREPFCLKAPALILVGVDIRSYDDLEKSYVPYLDGAVTVENLLLTAHWLGLGACMTKLGPGDLTQVNKDELKKIWSFFNVPSHFLPISIIALGYPKIVPKAPARKNIKDILFHEKF